MEVTSAPDLLRRQGQPILNNEQRAMLDADLTTLEIKEAIFALMKNKSPKPDGFNVDFCFKKLREK